MSEAAAADLGADRGDGVNPGEANQAYARAFVDELARSGLRHVCVSPGSRSTPLALALAEHAALRVWIHTDERSGAFFALGLAKASREPVALLCTSGTAAANYYPAVIEARYGRVPLVVLTADRPPELRENGASQSIDQLRLYGQHVKWHVEMALPDDTPGSVRYARTIACRAWATAGSSPPGPIHLNFPFREPLLPPANGVDGAADRWPLDADTVGQGGRPSGEPHVRLSQTRRSPGPELVERLASELASARQGLIVCGPQDDPDLPRAVTALAEALRWPVLADALSGVRCGQHDRSLVLDAYDAYLRDSEWVGAHEPDAVLRLGAAPTSKAVSQLLERYPECRQIILDSADGWSDPTLLASEVVHADAGLTCQLLAREVRERGAGGSAEWAASWLRADRDARTVIAHELSDLGEIFEGRVLSDLAELLPDGATLYVGNSMPVRDLDSFFPSTQREVRVLANRGANGIDGVVSSALGACAASMRPVVLVIGDLSFYHDMNGLLAAKQYGLSLTIVLINNDGGGIFSFLPQADRPEHFEQLFGTPHGLDFSAAVRMYGGEYSLASDWDSFLALLERGVRETGLRVIEVRTERGRNAALHREITAAVARAVRPAGAAVGSSVGAR